MSLKLALLKMKGALVVVVVVVVFFVVGVVAVVVVVVSVVVQTLRSAFIKHFQYFGKCF